MKPIAAFVACFMGLVVVAHQLAPMLHAQRPTDAASQPAPLHIDPRPAGQWNDPTIVRPPQLQFERNGELRMLPQVEIYGAAAVGFQEGQNFDARALHAAGGGDPAGSQAELIPTPDSVMPPDIMEPPAPMFEQIINESCQSCQTCRVNGGDPASSLQAWWLWLTHAHCDSGSNDRGVGIERVMNAPFEIYTTQPENNYRFRIDAAYGIDFPDRSEFIWARTVSGRGPKSAEERVKYQDIRMLIETGGPAFSTQVEVPIRVVDPVVNPNHAGLGDMNITTKTRLLNGDRWQLTQIFRTHLNTGSPLMGLGTGHVSLEPGLAYRYRWNDWFYLHGDTTYWFALGGHPTHSGQVLRTTFGMSGVLYENDVTALIPTLEFLNWTALNGQKTTDAGVPVGVDGEGMLTIQPGLRYVWDTGGDLGLFEVGMSGAVSVTGNHWHDSLLRLDLRWAY